MNHDSNCQCEGCRRLDRIGAYLYEPIPPARCSVCGGRGLVHPTRHGELQYQWEIPCHACQYCGCDHHLAAHKGNRCDPDLKTDCPCLCFIAAGEVGQLRQALFGAMRIPTGVDLEPRTLQSGEYCGNCRHPVARHVHGEDGDICNMLGCMCRTHVTPGCRPADTKLIPTTNPEDVKP